MTTPSYRGNVSLSVSVYEPDIVAGTSYDPAGALITDRVGDWLSGLSFETAANGGYKAATITFQDRQVDIEDWIASGLGRHVEVYDPALVKVWEGVVNSYSASVGSLAVTGGPLLDIGNRVSVVYAPILDATVDPPVVGVRQPIVAVVPDPQLRQNQVLVDLELHADSPTARVVVCRPPGTGGILSNVGHSIRATQHHK